MDLSCTAGQHQGHHHNAHLHTEQDLPAAALGHRSECRRVASDGLQTEVIVQASLSQLTAGVSHGVSGSVTQLFGSVRCLSAEDACGQRRSEAAEASSVSGTRSCFPGTSARLDKKNNKLLLCNHGLFFTAFLKNICNLENFFPPLIFLVC